MKETTVLMLTMIAVILSSFALGSISVAEPSTNQIGLYTGGTEWIRINGSGSMGIGDPTPDHLLDVAGSIGLTASNYILWGDTAGSSGYGLRDNSGTIEFKNTGGSWLPVASNTSGAGWTDDGSVIRLVTITDSIGIGTTSPSTKLEIETNNSVVNNITDIITLTHTTSTAVFANMSFETDTGNSLLTNLTSYWKLDEASGNRIDSLGRVNLTDQNTVTSASGKRSNAAQFTAANTEWLSSTDNTYVSTGNINFTFAFWTYLDTSTSQMFIDKWNYPANQREYLILTDASSVLGFWVSSDGTANGGSWDALTGPTLSTSTWYFVVVWHDADANTINIQVNNGTIYNKSWSTGVYDGTSDFRLGRNVDSYLNGRMDEVGYWKKALSAQERQDLYNSGSANTYASNQNTQIGSGILFKIQDTAGAIEQAGRISAILSDPTSGNETSALVFQTRYNGGDPSEKLRITGTGSVGIGTQYPQKTLHINTTNSGTILRLEGYGASPPGITLYKNGSQFGAIGAPGTVEGTGQLGLALFSETGHNISFYTNGSSTKRVTVDSSGKVGIGVSNPAARLTIQDADQAYWNSRGVTELLQLFRNSTDGVHITLGTRDNLFEIKYNTTGSLDQLEFRAGGSINALTILNDGGAGKVAVGAMPGATVGYTLSVNGTVGIGGTGSLYTVYRCAGGTYNGMLTLDNGNCPGGSAVATSLRID